MGGVPQTDGGPDGFTGGVRQLEVSIHSLRVQTQLVFRQQGTTLTQNLFTLETRSKEKAVSSTSASCRTFLIPDDIDKLQY